MPQTNSFTTVPEELISLLAAELPYSLPLFRRLQFTHVDGGTTSDSRTIFVSETGNPCDASGDPSAAFTVAFLGPPSESNTHVWVYSTLENKKKHHSGGYELNSRDEEYEQQLAALIGEMNRLYSLNNPEAVYPAQLLLGSVNSDTRAIMERFGCIRPRPTGFYDKWLLRVEDLPLKNEVLPEGMHWDRATLDDCVVVMSRTDIPRSPELLFTLPSVVIKLEDKTPIAWAFLGQDGSLVSVHCEPPYRRKGLARMLAAKLIRDSNHIFGSDGWCLADVAADNQASRSMCKALNGKPDWVVSWVHIVLSGSGG